MSEPDLIEVAIGGSTAVLERSERLLRLAPDPPDTNDPDEYQQHAETALMGRAIADLLSAGHIQTAHLGPLTAHMDALREGTNCEETAQGAEPVAFSAAALHALNHTAVGARRANAATMPTTRQILPPGFLQRDPRRGRRDDGGTCMERAVASVASNPATPSSVLAVLSNDTNTAVAVTAALNPARRGRVFGTAPAGSPPNNAPNNATDTLLAAAFAAEGAA